MEIAANVHYIKLFGANVFLLIEDIGLTLIDTGMPFSVRSIIRYIRATGYQPQDLKTILISHADFDHTGGVKSLVNQSEAKVYASQPAAEAMAKGISSREIQVGKLFTPILSFLERSFHLPKVEADGILSPGQVLPILGGLEVIDTSGHTPGHLSFYVRESGILFAGDSLRTRPGEILFNLHPSITWNQDSVIAATRSQEALEPQIICSGHGPVVYELEMKFPA